MTVVHLHLKHATNEQGVREEISQFYEDMSTENVLIVNLLSSTGSYVPR